MDRNWKADRGNGCVRYGLGTIYKFSHEGISPVACRGKCTSVHRLTANRDLLDSPVSGQAVAYVPS